MEPSEANPLPLESEGQTIKHSAPQPSRVDFFVKVDPLTISNKDKKEASPSGLSFWVDFFVKLAPVLVSIAGVVIGIWQFNKQSNDSADQDFNRRMLERTLAEYTAEAQIIGEISTIQLPNDSVALDTLIKNFDKKYWGTLLLVEQDSVRVALRELRASIYDLKMREGTIFNVTNRQDEVARQLRKALQKYRE